MNRNIISIILAGMVALPSAAFAEPGEIGGKRDEWDIELPRPSVLTFAWGGRGDGSILEMVCKDYGILCPIDNGPDSDGTDDGPDADEHDSGED